MIKNKIKSIDTYFTLAKMWHVRGKLERAIAGYQEVIKIRPDFIAAHLELGDLFTKQGRIEEAIAVYRRAAELNPDEKVFSGIISRLTEKSEKKSMPDKMFHRSIQNKTGENKHILLYTDCLDEYGVGQCNHLLLCELKSLGYLVTCAQSKASHSLIAERNRLGISHTWIEPDDIYSGNKTPHAFTNFIEAENIFTSVNPDLIIFANGSPLSSLAAKQTAVRLNIPFIEIIHCVTKEWAKQFASHIHKLQNIYKQASKVISVSQNNLDLLRKYFGLPNDKGEVIYNGRPDYFFKPKDTDIRKRIRQELCLPLEAVVAFTSGRMEIVKGYQFQVEAIKSLQNSEIWPNLYFVWAGTGTIENNLRAAVERLGATNHVRFLGQSDDIPSLLDAVDMFILASQFEGMPLSVMEAMAKELPVIATSVSGIPEELGNTGNLLTDPELNRQLTITELVNTIEDWVRDKDLRNQIGKDCKERAEKMFRVKPMLKRYVEVIETVPALTKLPDEVHLKHE